MKMSTPRGQIYRKSLALFIWLQKFEGCIFTKYDIDLPEMDFLASQLSPQECYDFYNQLSHRRTIQGGISIYALKEKTRQLPCTSLLTTWLTDPEELAFRSHENIEMKLRNIGRKDLARWIVERIESSLQRRRRLNDDEINRRIEESQRNEVIVVDRVGGKIMPFVSLEEQRRKIKGDDVRVDDKDDSCIFWKIFFSVLVVLLLIVLFACCYRFLYTKLRCICRRFDYSEDRKCCLPEQTYGSASISGQSPKKVRKTCNFFHCSANSRTNEDGVFMESANSEFSGKFSSASEPNDETCCTIGEKRALLLNPSNKLTKNRYSTEKVFSNYGKSEYFDRRNSLNEKSSSKIRKKIDPLGKISDHNYRLFDTFLPYKKPFESRSEGATNWEKLGKSRKIDFSRSEKRLKLSLSYCRLNFSTPTTSRIVSSREFTNRGNESKKLNSISNKSKIRSFEDKETSKWISCSCNEMSESGGKIPSASNSISSVEKAKNTELQNENRSQNRSFSNYARGDADSELSETYNELGMLFSEEMKRQQRPCRRNGCPLSRILRKIGKPPEHDEKKCKKRFGAISGYRALRFDERPSCGSAEICRDTYDEFQLMKATKDERERVARSIVERRKRFLDQPCLSPIPAQSFIDY